jgi:hypothetical protein
LKGYLAAVDFEARDGLSVDQFITVSDLFNCFATFEGVNLCMKQVVRSALSAKEDAADESDVLEAWVSLGAANIEEQRFTTSNHICPGGSPDKSGCIKAAKLSGVLSEFELAVDISKSVCFLSRCFLILFGDV